MKEKVAKRRTLKKKIQSGIRKIRLLKKRVPQKRVIVAKRRVAQSSLRKKAVKREAPCASVGTVLAQGEKERVEVSKFTAFQAPQENITRYNLPLRYHDNRIVLLARDPWWVHTYWDIAQDRINEVIARVPLHERKEVSWVLRVYDVTNVSNFNARNGNAHFDIGIHFEANSWYINVNQPERDWCVEIGFKTPSGAFFMIARSNTIKTPYFGISDIVDEEWALPDEEYYKILGVYDLGKSSLQMRKRVEEMMRGQISSGAFSGGVSSLFSMRQKKQRKFFLEVWTELILYGRTEPSAAVSVCGKKINLREDGTFSTRYALPEGDFRFDVVAASSDKLETLKRVPAVRRYVIK